MIQATEAGPKFLAATNDELVIGVTGMAAVALQLSGTWAGTVSFEAKVDPDAPYVAFNMVPSNSATAASSATANGAWSANCAGYEAVKARFSTATSGTVRAMLRTTVAAGRF